MFFAAALADADAAAAVSAALLASVASAASAVDAVSMSARDVTAAFRQPPAPVVETVSLSLDPPETDAIGRTKAVFAGVLAAAAAYDDEADYIHLRAMR